MTASYPLRWPIGRPRTERRRNAPFAMTGPNALSHLTNEVRLLGGRDLVVSTDMPVSKATGDPRWTTWRRGDDPGIAVYFALDGEEVVFACDHWTMPWDNLRAIGKTIEAIRGISRWGSEDMMRQAFSGYAALPAGDLPSASSVIPVPNPEDPWWIVLGVRQDATRPELDQAYRKWARVHHPDVGGNADLFRETTAAYQAAAREVRA